jgi:hypothetical protein
MWTSCISSRHFSGSFGQAYAKMSCWISAMWEATKTPNLARRVFLRMLNWEALGE